jgi:hypothetical protein
MLIRAISREIPHLSCSQNPLLHNMTCCLGFKDLPASSENAISQDAFVVGYEERCRNVLQMRKPSLV